MGAIAAPLLALLAKGDRIDMSTLQAQLPVQLTTVRQFAVG